MMVGAVATGGWFLPDLVRATPVVEVPVASPEQLADIQRILHEDMAASDVKWEEGCLTLMKQIRRGSAPQDFWDAYQDQLRIGERIVARLGASIDEVATIEEEYRASYLNLLAIAKRHGADTRAAEREVDA